MLFILQSEKKILLKFRSRGGGDEFTIEASVFFSTIEVAVFNLPEVGGLARTL